jgi:hypothetical protein
MSKRKEALTYSVQPNHDAQDLLSVPGRVFKIEKFVSGGNALRN